MGRTKVVSEPGRLKGAGSKAAGTGKRSYLFSEEEQRAMGSAAGSGGKGKGKPGSIPSVRAKVKGKKLGGGAAKPTVATVFTAEGQVVQKVCGTEKNLSWGSLVYSSGEGCEFFFHLVCIYFFTPSVYVYLEIV